MGEALSPDKVSLFLRSQGYTQDRNLGNGSYSNVRVAWSQKDKATVALKIVDERKAKTDYLTKFFKREKDIIFRLRHPHIVNFTDILRQGPLTIFVSDYAEGGDLLDHIQQKKRLPEKEVKFLFRQLVEALRYLHDKNFVHRDVKCENVFLDKHGNVKLGDFGFARLMQPTDLSETFCGSTAYAAPEITIGKAYSSCAVDLWSLGVVLYIMVTGFMPYDERDIPKMLQKQLEHRISYAASIRKEISDQVKDVIRALCHPVARLRPPHTQILQSPWLRDVPWLVRSDGDKILRVIQRHPSRPPPVCASPSPTSRKP